ncbi:hypothetical protein RMN56_07300 [Micromonospora halotolerans]|uniref:Secreted protein n=1 Tax=Micromonospora halotolerans TaxID=709879 RepID=A0ABZ0A105_9ACTN|nr:hypothetical protein [Micromonospora halotolerans]WNM41148.1 hypothetical protein RMN56_07300 [Micromonospora halotolerans]
MKTPRTVLVALLAGAALTACAGPGSEPGGPSPSGATPVTSSTGPCETWPACQPNPGPTGAPPVTSQPDPSVSPRLPNPTWKGGPSKPPGPGATTLSGTIRAGVEPNCVLIDDNLLIGGPRDLLKPGTRVEVTGRSEPGMMTTCQQGTPFVVESARRA